MASESNLVDELKSGFVGQEVVHAGQESQQESQPTKILTSHSSQPTKTQLTNEVVHSLILTGMALHDVGYPEQDYEHGEKMSKRMKSAHGLVGSENIAMVLRPLCQVVGMPLAPKRVIKGNLERM
jgi:hypothetical protein